MFLVAWLSATRKREVYHEDPELHETHLPRERQVSGPFFFCRHGVIGGQVEADDLPRT